MVYLGIASCHILEVGHAQILSELHQMVIQLFLNILDLL